MKVVKIPIYYGNFIIIFADDTNIDKVCKIVSYPTENISSLYAYSFNNFMFRNKESFAVAYNFWTISTITLGTIVHEVNHTGNNLLAAREFIPDWNNDEAESYLKGWMADEVSNFMQKCNIV